MKRSLICMNVNQRVLRYAKVSTNLIRNVSSATDRRQAPEIVDLAFNGHFEQVFRGRCIGVESENDIVTYV